MIYVMKINLEMASNFSLPTKCPLTFLMLLDRLQDINRKVSWNVVRSSTKLRVKEALFLLFDEPWKKGVRSAGGLAEGGERAAQAQLFHSQRKS